MEQDGIRVFISHRPADAGGFVMALQTSLASRFGRSEVLTFADVARQHPGIAKSEQIQRGISSADVVVAVIGKDWLTAADEVGNHLEDPEDRPRRELEAAFDGNITLIPVLVGGARMPRADELPDTLKGLSGHQGVTVTDAAFDFGVGQLVTSIENVAQPRQAEPEPPAPVAAPPPAATPAPVRPQPSTGPSAEDLMKILGMGSIGIPRRRDAGASPGTKALQSVFGLLGLAAGAGAGIYAYRREDSVWLAVFVGLIALQIISRGVADVITDDKKARRALYFLFLPALSATGFYFAYQVWEEWWLAFVIGLVGGAIVNGILAPLFFPGIHREEQADTKRRWGVQA